MRELKFRAWIKRAQQMASWEEIQEKQNLSRLIGNPEYPLMQFTGMEDSNGKEIYEGDIIKQTHVVPEEEITSLSVIEYKDGMFVVHDKHFNEWDSLKDNAYSCEVVGNIYENPELDEDDIGFEEEDIAAANAWANSLQDDI